MLALQSHSWCHLKKDGRLRLRYHHTTTLNKDHDELKTSMAMIHAIPIIIEKAGSPMIGLSARITLFVVVCVPLLAIFFCVEMEDQVFTWSSIFHMTHLLFTLLKSSSTSIRNYV